MKSFLKVFSKLDSKANQFKNKQIELINEYNKLSNEEKQVVNSTPFEIEGLPFDSVEEFVNSLETPAEETEDV